jgi:hypothetical protein
MGFKVGPDGPARAADMKTLLLLLPPLCSSVQTHTAASGIRAVQEIIGMHTGVPAGILSSMGKSKRIRADPNRAAKLARRDSSKRDEMISIQLPRPNVTTFTNIAMVPRFPPGHPLGGSDLPPDGSPGKYAVDAVLGVPGMSQSAFANIDWNTIWTQGDSLIEVPDGVSGATQSGLLGGPGGEQVFTYEFGINSDRHLANAKADLQADGFHKALSEAQDVLESYLSVLSFHHDVPVEVVAWRVTEEGTGAMLFATKHLGKVKVLDPALSMLSSPEIRELLSTWRESMNAPTPMAQALGFYKIIERTHRYRVGREEETRGTDHHYTPPREKIPDAIDDLTSEYGMNVEAFSPFLGKKFTSVWGQDLRERIRNAVAHLREDAPSLTADRAADIEECRRAVPVLHYIAYTMLQREITDAEQWPNPA